MKIGRGKEEERKKEGKVVVVGCRKQKRMHTHTKRDAKTRLNRDLYV